MRYAILTAAVLLIPRAALACPVCFGQSDSPMASAMNLGIFALLGVIVAVLGGFAAFMLHLGRREQLATRGDEPGNRQFALPGTNSQEGSAPC